MATIYISSTYDDLKDYRKVVFDALRKSGYQVKAMEDYVATDQRPVDKCLKDVAEADIYVGIFAFRYGYVPPARHGNADGLSITELEFRHAERLNKPCLIFIATEETVIPLPLADAYTGDGKKGERISEFRRYLLTEKLASSFSSPYQLSTLVLAAITKYEKETADETKRHTSESAPAITWDINKNGSPYPGLMHFTHKYAPVFFGREAEVIEVLDRLRLPEGRFLVISGGSGTGKSSLVEAGVLPKIEETGIGAQKCVSVRMVPSQGSHPFDALLRPLHGYAERAGLNVFELAKEIAAQPNNLPEKIQEIVSKGINGEDLVFFLDQMEELFTALHPEVSNTFLTALYEAAQNGSLRVIATIRSDYLHHLHDRLETRRILDSKGHYPLGPVAPFMLADMIVKPAKCAGLSVSENLASRIVHDTGTEQGSLPLLAFVLNQLFENRRTSELSETVYKTLGGITGAIAQHSASVEATIRSEQGTKAFELLPKVFESLVIVKDESLPTRQRPLLTDFPPETGQVVNVLIERRLLHTEGEGNTATVSLSHEKLFEAWPLLRDYIERNRKRLIDQTLLESRARKWADGGKPWFDGLVSGWERREFQRSEVRSHLAEEYLSASRRAQCIRTIAIVLPLALVLGIGTWLWKQGVTIQYAVSIALARLNLLEVVEPEMVWIPGGAFQQGDVHGSGESNERPVREVKLKPFKMGKYEVTFEEYDGYVELTGRRQPDDAQWGRERRPVIYVSWQDAVAYVRWLSQATGKLYRLPTESEWEYAARSRGKDEVYAGTSESQQLADYAVFGKDRTEPVGSRKPNGIGLYDMSGNVWEWVEDCGHATYNDAPSDGSAWLGADGGLCGRRMFRGGSWNSGPRGLRSSHRVGTNADNSNYLIGFRLAQDLE